VADSPKRTWADHQRFDNDQTWERLYVISRCVERYKITREQAEDSLDTMLHTRKVPQQGFTHGDIYAWFDDTYAPR